MLVPPPPPPGLFEGFAGLARAVAILLAATLFGLALGAADNAAHPPASIGAQS